ncbi:BRCT domain-containing protein [Hesseltinella vesiculosa]|uniref:BRCT domain-containing protein n=1 Tax=Hesseltinella vesiculosa TaxID=101127 RepID=A0A1X2GU15_9FUNG|nr:BRCT domain-containing protein [Hesseltinella vesiculosa]
MTSVQFTVGKLDAGMAILLTEDHHLIEFPSLLLPKGVASGSIVNISVNRNISEEERKMQEFWDLQNTIVQRFGEAGPEVPTLRVKNITQTSLILEWDVLELHTATLRSLDVYKNNTKLTQQVPGETNFIKLSGLDVDHEYEFYIVIKTTAGQYESNRVTVRTHKMDNLTGIQVAFGNFESQDALDQMKHLLDKIGATWTNDVNHETTHLIAQIPGDRNYETAVKYSIPIVKPEWLLQCDLKKTIQPALPYYIVDVPNLQ